MSEVKNQAELKIALEGIRFFAHHGYYEEERLSGQEFILDVYVTLQNGYDLSKDHIQETINYEGIYKLCTEVMEEPKELLETVVFNLKEKMKEKYDEQISHLSIRLSKHVNLGGPLDRVFVELSE